MENFMFKVVDYFLLCFFYVYSDWLFSSGLLRIYGPVSSFSSLLGVLISLSLALQITLQMIVCCLQHIHIALLLWYDSCHGDTNLTCRLHIISMIWWMRQAPTLLITFAVDQLELLIMSQCKLHHGVLLLAPWQICIQLMTWKNWMAACLPTSCRFQLMVLFQHIRSPSQGCVPPSYLVAPNGLHKLRLPLCAPLWCWLPQQWTPPGIFTMDGSPLICNGEIVCTQYDWMLLWIMRSLLSSLCRLSLLNVVRLIDLNKRDVDSITCSAMLHADSKLIVTNSDRPWSCSYLYGFDVPGSCQHTSFPNGTHLNIGGVTEFERDQLCGIGPQPTSHAVPETYISEGRAHTIQIYWVPNASVERLTGSWISSLDHG